MIERFVHAPQLVAEREAVRHAAGEVRRPDELGQILATECTGAPAEEDDQIEDLPTVEDWNRRSRTHPCTILGARIGGVDPQLIDHLRDPGVEQRAEQPAFQERKPVPIGPGIDLVIPRRRARDAISRPGNAPACERDDAVDGRVGRDAPGIEAEEILWRLLSAHLAHRLHDVFETMRPVVGAERIHAAS